MLFDGQGEQAEPAGTAVVELIYAGEHGTMLGLSVL